jgi:hypothetical protein
MSALLGFAAIESEELVPQPLRASSMIVDNEAASLTEARRAKIGGSVIKMSLRANVGDGCRDG